jgi:hypothetical protein
MDGFTKFKIKMMNIYNSSQKCREMLLKAHISSQGMDGWIDGIQKKEKKKRMRRKNRLVVNV